jgi:hypothetical protein
MAFSCSGLRYRSSCLPDCLLRARSQGQTPFHGRKAYERSLRVVFGRHPARWRTHRCAAIAWNHCGPVGWPVRGCYDGNARTRSRLTRAHAGQNGAADCLRSPSAPDQHARDDRRRDDAGNADGGHGMTKRFPTVGWPDRGRWCCVALAVDKRIRRSLEERGVLLCVLD